MNSPKVSIIVLNWNGLSDTQECIRSLLQVTYPTREVILIDNASIGDDVLQLEWEFGDSIRILRNERNYGFAGGNNIGIRHVLDHSSPDYVFLLNNDTTVAPDILDEMVKAAESDPGVGLLGPKIYFYDFDGRKDVIWTAGGKIRWWHPWVYDAFGHNDDDLPRYQEPRTVHWVSGAAMMIRREVIDKIGLLDSGYFFGTEDVEYSLKARAHGFKCLYVPTARVWHKVGRSRSRRVPSFADLPDYYRLLRRNFPKAVCAYHLLISPVLISHRTFFWMRSALTGPRKRRA
ncbi:MAG: glycosyltransferase family 2 protein [Dehalococcoidia bacterium]|nr:glycosyltransferase family 2 protein [Dehalococcoidia bacterium]